MPDSTPKTTGPVGPNTTTNPPPARHEFTVDVDRWRLTQNQYKHDMDRKTQITIHYTGGTTVSGAIAQWESTKTREGTAYIIDPAGNIYQTFPDNMWAGHLGVDPGQYPKLNPDNILDRQAIGIELVNVGHLKLDSFSKSLNWWPNNWTTKYCGIDETAKYKTAGYRGFGYFAKFPDIQQEACAWLCALLCRKYSIPVNLVDPNKRDTCLLYPPYAPGTMRDFRGIAGHYNFRTDKLDPGPAFDWDALARYLAGHAWIQSTKFKTTGPAEIDPPTAPRPLTDEPTS